MKHVDFLQVVIQVFSLIGSKDAQGEAYQGPEMNDAVSSAIMLAELMDLGMAVVTCGNAVIGSGGLNLGVLDFPVLEPLLFVPGLQKTAPAAAAEIIGPVGVHIDKVLFAYYRFDDKAKIFCHRIAKALADDLAGILNGELDLEVFVPFGIDLELALADPLGIIFVNAFNLEVVVDVEFFQSGPD
jgi:hypothetical protein